jgi:hypothetical protein
MLDLPDRRMAGSPAQGHGRKAIHGAGILIVQPDDAVASAWREALVDFGMAGVRTVASIEEAIETIIARPPSAIVVAAANAGFDAVLPYPLHPRLIYRRMGSLMQKARRSARKRGGPLIADARLGEQVG